MLKRLILKSVLAATLIITTFSLGQNVFADNGGEARANRLTGTVVEIDRANRSLKVRDNKSGKIYTVIVPESTSIRLSAQSPAPSGKRALTFERMMPGLIVDVIVEN